MDLDFYLSEMAVSDKHGGGLSLQRVLGNDLDGIKHFIHLTKFCLFCPATERLKPRCLDWFSPFEGEQMRRTIGCRPSDWISRQDLHHVWQARRVAKRIARKFKSEKRPLRALVCPQSTRSLLTLEALVRRRPVDYVTWMMDDHIVRWRNGAWEYPPGVEGLLGRHLKRAKKVFVISPVMGDFYRERFGVDSQVLFGPAEPRDWRTENGSDAKKEIRLAYFGAVEKWQSDPLAHLADGLQAAGATLDVYTLSGWELNAKTRPDISFKSPIPADKVLETMHGYDAVVLPISFTPEMRQMSEFNIATKMSECIASGTITLVIGPAYAAMVRFLQPAGVASILTDVPIANLPEQLNKLKNTEYRRSTLERAQQLVHAELSTQVMRRRWAEGISTLNGGA